jgi:hypothetical protein
VLTVLLRRLIIEKIQVINELYNSVYAALKANSDLKKYVTNIYDYLPKQVTIPYLKIEHSKL